MSYLPSKKVQVVAFVVLIILIGLFWYVGKQKTTPKDNGSELVYTSEEVSNQKDLEAKITNFIEAKITEQGGLKEVGADSFKPQINYTAANITTSPDNSNAALKNYGLSLKDTLAPMANINHQEAKLTIKAIEEENEDYIVEIKNRALELRQVTQKLEQIKVPSSALEIHLKLINSVDHLNGLLVNMSIALDEPLVALEAAKVYSVDALNFYNILGEVNQFFTANNVEFSTKEKLEVDPGINN